MAEYCRGKGARQHDQQYVQPGEQPPVQAGKHVLSQYAASASETTGSASQNIECPLARTDAEKAITSAAQISNTTFWRYQLLPDVLYQHRWQSSEWKLEPAQRNHRHQKIIPGMQVMPGARVTIGRLMNSKLLR